MFGDVEGGIKACSEHPASKELDEFGAFGIMVEVHQVAGFGCLCWVVCWLAILAFC